MCKDCEDAEKEYPELGEGAFLQVKGGTSWVSVDPQQGIRIAQKRVVTYAGPEGVVEREELGMVYVDWDGVDDLILHLIAANVARAVIEKEKENDD